MGGCVTPGGPLPFPANERSTAFGIHSAPISATPHLPSFPSVLHRVHSFIHSFVRSTAFRPYPRCGPADDGQEISTMLEVDFVNLFSPLKAFVKPPASTRERNSTRQMAQSLCPTGNRQPVGHLEPHDWDCHTHHIRTTLQTARLTVDRR